MMFVTTDVSVYGRRIVELMEEEPGGDDAEDSS